MRAGFLHNILKDLLPFVKERISNYEGLEWVSNIDDKHDIRRDVQKVIKGLKLYSYVLL